jgi:hypothetical protein
MNFQNIFVVGVSPRFDVVQNIVLLFEFSHQSLDTPKLERVVEAAHVNRCVLAVLGVVVDFHVCKVGQVAVFWNKPHLVEFLAKMHVSPHADPRQTNRCHQNQKLKNNMWS